MNIIKKYGAAIILAATGLLALSLGFAAAFGKAYGGTSTVKNFYDLKMHGAVGSHAGMAYAGGIITGVFGLFAMGAAALIIFMKLEGKIILISAIIAGVVLFILSVAAIACQAELNSVPWVTSRIIVTF